MDWAKVRKVQEEYTRQMKDLVADMVASRKVIKPKLTGANYHFTKMKDNNKNIISVVMQSWN